MKRNHSQANEEEQEEQDGKNQKKSRLQNQSQSQSQNQLPASVRFDLPPQLDLESEIQSRSQQIRSLRAAMKSARSNATTRAWQLLPRAQRRRAASHNLLRLPKRLRKKGYHEMKSSATEPLSKSQIRKKSSSHPLSLEKIRRIELIKRASKDKSRNWLETHLWHSKRFRMTGFKGKKRFRLGRNDRFGFVLAEEPNMKSQKANLRDSLKKSSLHDSSYEKFFRISVSIPEIRKPKEYQRKNEKGEKRSGQSNPETEKLFTKEAIRDREIRDHREATSILASVLEFAGLAHGWQEEFNHGARECQTSLLGKVDSDSPKKRPDSELGFVQALAPVRILWIPSPIDRLENVSSSSIASEKLSSAESESDRMQIDPTSSIPPTIPSATSDGSLPPENENVPTLRIGVPVKDQPSIQSQRLEQFQRNRGTLSQNNRNLKRKSHRAILSHPIPVRPTRELILRIHPGGLRDLRKNLLDSVKGLDGKGPLPSITQPFTSLSINLPRPMERNEPEKQEGEGFALLHISELSNFPDPEISAGSKRRTPASVSQEFNRRESTLEKRREMGIVKDVEPHSKKVEENSKHPPEKGHKGKKNSKKGRILKGSARANEIKSERKDKAKSDEILRERRREGWNAFELLGPDSGRVLGGVLRLTNGNQGVKKETFRILTQDLLPSEIPSGLVLSLEVHDPRLTFPPKNSKSQRKVSDPKLPRKVSQFQQKLNQELFNSNLAKGRLLTEGKDLPRFTQGDIHSRKSKLLVPGTSLTPTSEDDVIPIVLIQRNLTISSTTGSINEANLESPLSGWTLLVPRGWSNAFWLSLVHTGSRVLGQDGIRQLAFEGNSLMFPSSSSPSANLPTDSSSTLSDSKPLNEEASSNSDDPNTNASSSSGPISISKEKKPIPKVPIKSSLGLAFPYTWVGTSSFKQEERISSKVLKMEWERRPRGKRVEFEKLGVKFPWGGEEMWREILANGKEISSFLNPWSGETCEGHTRNLRPCLIHVDSFRLEKIKELALPSNTDPDPDSDPGPEYEKSSSERFLNLFKNNPSARRKTQNENEFESDDPISEERIGLVSKIMDQALVMVSVVACRRGALHEGAGIYLLKDRSEETAWRNCLIGIQEEETSSKIRSENGSNFDGNGKDVGEGQEEEEEEDDDDEGEDEVGIKLDRNQDFEEMEELKALFGSSRSPKETTNEELKMKKKIGLEKFLGKDDQFNKELSLLECKPADGSKVQVGSVPLGGFSLSIGRGFALGAMSLRAYLEVLDRGQKFSESENGKGKKGKKGKGRESKQDDAPLNLVLMRERNGGVWRAARVELAVM